MNNQNLTIDYYKKSMKRVKELLIDSKMFN